MYHADVLIHINEDLDDEHIHALERTLSMHDGVVSACVPEGRRHLLMVDYEPRRVRSNEILSEVRARGVHADLVGM